MISSQFVNDNLSIIVLLLMIDYILKAIALWISARKNSKVWFCLLLILNTIGILPLFYIFYFSRQEKSQPKLEKTS